MYKLNPITGKMDLVRSISDNPAITKATKILDNTLNAVAFGKYFGLLPLVAFASQSINAPTDFISSFTIDSILGQLNWTDTNAGAAEYEVYSSTNGAAEVLLGTTISGATSYQDTTCKQNASVVYRIRAKKGIAVTDFVAANILKTPLCWKTNQSVLTPVDIYQLNIAAGKSVTIHWGEGTSQTYSGQNASITKNYSLTGQYNIWITGDINDISVFQHSVQIKTKGVITNWILPSALYTFDISSTGFTGNVTNWVLPSGLSGFFINSTALTGVLTNWVFPSGLLKFHIYSTVLTGDVTNWVFPSGLNEFYINLTGLTGDVTNWVLPLNLLKFQIYSTGLTGVVNNWVLPSVLNKFQIYSTGLTGSFPQIAAHATIGLDYRINSCSMSDSNVTVFRKAMTTFNVGSQNVAFPTANINKLLKAAADWYQVNAPTANCTYTMSGANMGIPTGGVSNADLTRLVGYYTAAGKSCTVLVRTS